MNNPDEFITRIQGMESLCITKVAFTTNLGHKCEVGNDFVAMSNVNPDDSIQPFSGSQNPQSARLGHRMNPSKNEMATDLQVSERMARMKKSGMAGNETRKFEAEIPKGAQVVCLAGVCGSKRLLSL